MTASPHPLILEEWDALRAGAEVPGGWPYNATSVVYENARIVKAGAGRLYGLAGYSSRASAQFVQVFDAALIPADGAVPVLLFTVPTVTNFSLYFGPMGRWFYRGIVVCNSSTGPTKTIGAADTWFDAQFE